MIPREKRVPPRPHARALGAALTVTGVLMASPALAYVGPGAGLTAIGTVLALVAALALAVVGFVWYPIKRLRRRRRAEANGPIENEASEQR